jgi:transcriptional regulator with XRE-family HTH domain
LSSVPSDSAAWEQLGKIARRRREELGLTQAEVAGLAGIATQTVHRLEKGVRPSRYTSSWSKLERALGWLPGSIDAILEGGMPAAGSYGVRFLPVPIDKKTEFVQNLVRKITFEIDPDTPLSRLVAAEAAAEAALREAGLLPPLDDQESDKPHPDE